MPNVNISFNVKQPTGLLNSSQLGSNAAQYLLEEFQAAVSGTNQSDGIIYNVNESVALNDEAYAGPAIAALFIDEASAVDEVGGTIGKAATAVVVVYATSGVATATALAAAIRANTTVNRKVTATNVAMVVTLSTVTAGQYLDVCNVRFTGVAGTVVKYGDFSIDTSNTAAALSLALAINRHPSTAMRYRALSVAGVVYIVPSTYRTLTPTMDKWAVLSNPGSFTTIALTARVPAANARCFVLAVTPGDAGNEIALAASGTGVTQLTNSATAGYLGNGTGTGRTNYLDLP